MGTYLILISTTWLCLIFRSPWTLWKVVNTPWKGWGSLTQPKHTLGHPLIQRTREWKGSTEMDGQRTGLWLDYKLAGAGDKWWLSKIPQSLGPKENLKSPAGPDQCGSDLHQLIGSGQWNASRRSSVADHDNHVPSPHPTLPHAVEAGLLGQMGFCPTNPTLPSASSYVPSFLLTRSLGNGIACQLPPPPP